MYLTEIDNADELCDFANACARALDFATKSGLTINREYDVAGPYFPSRRMIFTEPEEFDAVGFTNELNRQSLFVGRAAHLDGVEIAAAVKWFDER